MKTMALTVICFKSFIESVYCTWIYCTNKFVGTHNSLGLHAVHAVHVHRISHRIETVTGCRQSCVLCFTPLSPILPSPIVIKSCRPASLWWFLLSVRVQFAICEDPAASCNGPCYCYSKYWFLLLSRISFASIPDVHEHSFIFRSLTLFRDSCTVAVTATYSMKSLRVFCYISQGI